MAGKQECGLIVLIIGLKNMYVCIDIHFNLYCMVIYIMFIIWYVVYIIINIYIVLFIYIIYIYILKHVFDSLFNY